MNRIKRNQDIKYINPEIPHFELPEVRGSRYQVKAPDTLDLAERARHAVHGLTATTDPEANFEIYWLALFGWKPITMRHDLNDHCEFKYYASSILLRLACGSDELLEVEWHRMANILQMQGTDGLLYIPLVGRPWGKDFGTAGDMYKSKLGEHTVDITMLGRKLEAVAVYYELTGDSQWDRLARRAIAGLQQLAIDKGDFAFLPKLFYALGEKSVGTVFPPPPTINHGYIWLGHGLITYYRMTGCEEALELGYKLARFYSLGHSGFIGPKGEFRLNHGDTDFKGTGRAHFHTHTLMRMFMLNAGIAKGDKEMIELAQQGYQYGKDNGESETLMGYFPENLGPKEEKWMRKSLEMCEVADMIYLGLRQSTEGLADCWDDVDRWVRNMFAEMQLLKTDWAYEFSEKYGCPPHSYPKQDPFNPQYATTEKVPERCRGAWGGWALPNDWQGNPECSIMACCVGNASMQLYRVWRDMLSYDKVRNRLSVHLLLNRASIWADINSHIPYKGQVDVHLKCDCEVAMRIPEWTTPRGCRLTVNGGDRTPAWEGRYMVVKGKKGENVTLKCPIAERTETLRIVEKDYKVIVRGNEIVDIDPPGVHHPLFHRPQYRSEETKWRTVERFVAEETVALY